MRRANTVRARVEYSGARERHWWRWGQAAWVAALSAIVAWPAFLAGSAVAAAAPSLTGRQPTIRGVDVVRALAAGRSFDRRNLSIIGDVNMGRLRVVRVGLRCQHCTLEGSLLGRDVRFKDVVDLSGTTVTGRVDLRGALFGRGLAWRDGSIDGTTSASLAVFRNLVDANGLSFGRRADFTGARFLAAANFGAADFRGPALFDGVAFGGTATFTSGGRVPGHQGAEPSHCPQGQAGSFSADASFTGATFTAADFRGRCFHATASFAEVIVHGPAAFDGAWFLHQANFENAVITGDLSFLASRFKSTADFDGVVVGADLNFDYAELAGRTMLSHAAVTGTLSFWLTISGAKDSLEASRNLRAGGLVLDPNDIAWVAGSGAQINMLQRVERTARASGQIDVANNARFAWLQMASAHQKGIAGMPDHLLYRDIAGYLVRPWYPVRTLLLLIAAGIIVNAMMIGNVWQRIRRKLRLRRRPGPYPPRLGRATKRSSLTRAFVSAVPFTLRTVFWRHPAEPELPASARFVTIVESTFGKALGVAFLMCVANVNPTLHQFIDALLRSKP